MDLIIAQSVNNIDYLKKSLTASTHILALNQSVMMSLDKIGIRYSVIQDFYSEDEYYKDVSVYRKKIKIFLYQLDKECQIVTDFKYAFSGNEHYFSTLFDDLMYLEKLIHKIRSKYKKIYLYAPIKPEKMSNKIISFSELNSRTINGTISIPLERTENRFIQLIYNTIEVFFLKDEKKLQELIPFKYKINHFVNRLKSYLDRKLFYNNYKKNKYSKTSNKKVYLIQDTYEVTLLKKYLSNFNFINRITNLRQVIERENPIDMSSSTINNILDIFVRENFLYLNQYIHLLINSYHLEVVGRISSFKKNLNQMIKKDKPHLFLMGAGTRDVFDTICCYLANFYKIPVIIFQHGGTRIFNDKAYDESLEYNNRVSKTLIVQAKKDIEKFQNIKTKVICMGSIQQFEKNQYLIYKPFKDIFFCIGPDTNYSFRHLLEFYSINKKYRQSIEILKTIEEKNLSVDLKLHPSGEKNSLKNYLRIIKDYGFTKTKILYGGAAEVFIGNYKLIIIDFLASAVRKHIFSMKIPIIIYDEHFDKMRISPEVLTDLSKRCYIARNYKELSDLLDKYKLGKLPSKWSNQIIDDYIYPIANGNPGKNIAEYIENHILHGN